jgi:hypothetical protein
MIILEGVVDSDRNYRMEWTFAGFGREEGERKEARIWERADLR